MTQEWCELSWDSRCESCNRCLNSSTDEREHQSASSATSDKYTWHKLCVTLRSGLSLVSMMNSYLQSSQQRVSELLIHCCRQDWWTKRRLPVQWHGVIRGLSSSPSQWQILREPKNIVNAKLQEDSCNRRNTGKRKDQTNKKKKEKLAGKAGRYFPKLTQTWVLEDKRQHE